MWYLNPFLTRIALNQIYGSGSGNLPGTVTVMAGAVTVMAGVATVTVVILGTVTVFVTVLVGPTTGAPVELTTFVTVLVTVRTGDGVGIVGTLPCRSPGAIGLIGVETACFTEVSGNEPNDGRPSTAESALPNRLDENGLAVEVVCTLPHACRFAYRVGGLIRLTMRTETVPLFQLP
jgi:hypothetical protein